MSNRAIRNRSQACGRPRSLVNAAFLSGLLFQRPAFVFKVQADTDSPREGAKYAKRGEPHSPITCKPA